MSTDVIIVVVIVAIIAYFILFRRPKDAQSAGTTIDASSSAQISAIEKTPEALDIAAAQEAFEAGARARSAAFSEYKASLSEAEAKITEAEEFVRKSSLDVAVPWLWDHMQHWGSWKKIPDRWTPPIALDDLSGARGVVSWTWRGQAFAMRFTKWESFGFTDSSTDFGTIAVEASGQVVVAITAKTDISKDYDRWHYSGVDTLTVGPWIAEFIGFYQAVRLADETCSYEEKIKTQTAKAAKINLG